MYEYGTADDTSSCHEFLVTAKFSLRLEDQAAAPVCWIHSAAPWLYSGRVFIALLFLCEFVAVK